MDNNNAAIETAIVENEGLTPYEHAVYKTALSLLGLPFARKNYMPIQAVYQSGLEAGYLQSKIDLVSANPDSITGDEFEAERHSTAYEQTTLGRLEQFLGENGERLKLPAEISGSLMTAIVEFVKHEAAKGQWVAVKDGGMPETDGEYDLTFRYDDGTLEVRIRYVDHIFRKAWRPEYIAWKERSKPYTGETNA